MGARSLRFLRSLDRVRRKMCNLVKLGFLRLCGIGRPRSTGRRAVLALVGGNVEVIF
jgi:hypothetical protein